MAEDAQFWLFANSKVSAGAGPDGSRSSRTNSAWIIFPDDPESSKINSGLPSRWPSNRKRFRERLTLIRLRLYCNHSLPLLF